MNPPLRLLFCAFAVAYGWAPLVAPPIAEMLESAGIGSGDPELVRAIERWRLIDKVGATVNAHRETPKQHQPGGARNRHHGRVSA